MKHEAGGSQADRKQRAILGAAQTVFLRDGFAGASMDEVARQGGVSKQTVYAHFSSKADLFAAVVTSLSVAVSGGRSAIAPVADAATDLEAPLTTYAERQLKAALTPDMMQLRRLLIGEAARFPELAAGLHEQGSQRAVSALARELGRLSRAGLLEIDDPRAAAIDFIWLVLGEPLNRALLLGDEAIPSARALRAHAERAVGVFLSAYGRD